MHTLETLLDDLRTAEVPYVLHEHAPVFTVEEAQRLTAHLPGVHIKNLFLKDKAGCLFLVVAEHARRLDLKTLGKHVGAKDRLSFGSPELLWATLGVLPGSVSPLALINAEPGLLRVVLDTAVFEGALVNPHPLVNTATVALSHDALATLLRRWGHTWDILDLGLFARPDTTAA